MQSDYQNPLTFNYKYQTKSFESTNEIKYIDLTEDQQTRTVQNSNRSDTIPLLKEDSVIDKLYKYGNFSSVFENHFINNEQTMKNDIPLTKRRKRQTDSIKSSSSSAYQTNNEVLALELKNGRPQLLINFGGGSIVLDLNKSYSLADNLWHRIDIFWKDQVIHFVPIFLYDLISKI